MQKNECFAFEQVSIAEYSGTVTEWKGIAEKKVRKCLSSFKRNKKIYVYLHDVPSLKNHKNMEKNLLFCNFIKSPLVSNGRKCIVQSEELT